VRPLNFTVRSHMKHVAALLLALVPIVASALESDEFQLFGLNAAGHVVEIRPYGADPGATGDMDDPGGIHGNFYKLVGSEAKGSMKLAGVCRLLGKGSWTLSCDQGALLLSGVTYKGEPISDDKAEVPPVAKRLYRAFIKRYGYGALGAVFHCTAGCSPKIPQDLVLVWRGD
jgi:hypothetical protein